MSTIIVPRKPSTPALPERLAVSHKEAAEMLSVSDKTLRNWTKQGKIQGRKVNRRVLYSIEAIRRFIDGTDSAGESVQQ